MRRFETKTHPAREYEKEVEVRCDLCGRSAPRPGDYDTHLWASHGYGINCVDIKIQTGESYPECTSSETRSYDVCPECFEGKVEPFLQSLGAEPRTEKYDR